MGDQDTKTTTKRKIHTEKMRRKFSLSPALETQTSGRQDMRLPRPGSLL